MAGASEAPQQYKQPSRKGKRAWRKNVDVSQIQEGLQTVRDEEIKGGVVAEKSSTDLFTLDTEGSQSIQKTYNRSHRSLKADEILAQRSAVPAYDTRKRASSRLTDGIVEPRTKKRKIDWVSNKEQQRLKKVAQTGNAIQSDALPDQEATGYDPWAESESSNQPRNGDLNFLDKTKPAAAPKTLKRKPISLTASGKPIPAVRDPLGGTSYNPVFQDWDNLLAEEGRKEVENEKKRRQEQQEEEAKQARITAANDEADEARTDDESAWEGIESEYENPEWLKKKRPERKTAAQRNKIKRRKEAERKALHEAHMARRRKQTEQIRMIAKAVEANERRRNMLEVRDGELSDDGDDGLLRRRRFGNISIPEKPIEVVLPDELQESLRLLKPEGNLLKERFRNMLIQGKIETRRPISQSKKPRRIYTEKWTYKDFKIKPKE